MFLLLVLKVTMVTIELEKNGLNETIKHIIFLPKELKNGVRSGHTFKYDFLQIEVLKCQWT